MSPSIHVSERNSASSSTSDLTGTTSVSSTASSVANFWVQSAPQYITHASTTSSSNTSTSSRSRPRDYTLEATLEAWSWDQPVRQAPEPRRGPRDELIPGADEQMCERKRETKLGKMKSKLPGAGKNFAGRSPYEKKSWWQV